MRYPLIAVVIKGHFLDYPHGAWRSYVDTLLRQLEEHFYDATNALALYVQERSTKHPEMDRDQEWELQNGIMQQLMPTEELPFRAGDMGKAYAAARLQVMIEKAKAGYFPRGLTSRLRAHHAKSFVYAFDLFQEALHRLAETPGLPQGVRDARAAFDQVFPDLRDVRNSAHHPNDRSLGLRHSSVTDKGERRDKPMDPNLDKLPPEFAKKGADGSLAIGLPSSVPASISVSLQDGKVILRDSFHGDVFACTLANGATGRMPITEASLDTMTKCLQTVYDALPWHGGKDDFIPR